MTKIFDENNPMFDLNRDLINEEKGIKIITQDNVSEIVLEIMRRNTTNKNKSVIQGNLFD